jgi:heterodisulfide reductase subunit A-like polyferredoxin
LRSISASLVLGPARSHALLEEAAGTQPPFELRCGRQLVAGRVLFIDAEPAGFLIGAQPEFCRTWANQEAVTVAGSHFLPEDAPEAVSDATARFVAKVLAGQIA